MYPVVRGISDFEFRVWDFPPNPRGRAEPEAFRIQNSEFRIGYAMRLYSPVGAEWS